MSMHTTVFGLHAVTALIQKNPEAITRLYILSARHDERMQRLIDVAEHAEIKIEWVERARLDQLSAAGNHQGVVAVCGKNQQWHEKDLPQLIAEINGPPFLLILDGIQDPHNLGAILRSADAAGVHAVIAPKDKSVGLTATVRKVASGAAEAIPFIQVTNLVRCIKQLKELNIWVYGAVEPAADTAIFYHTNFSKGLALVVGNEGQGLRRLTRESCDGLITIPMQGSVSSLNVSVATGVLLFEVVRQRLQ